VSPLRLVIYDRTCLGRRGNGLSPVWWAGAQVWTGLGRADASLGVSSWAAALRWLATVESDRTIGRVEFWGHGRRGMALVERDVLDAGALGARHPHAAALDQVRERLDPGAWWWFRTCDTFGADRGQDFARRWTDRLGCAAAGHTYVIGAFQSGLHRLAPGVAPHWSAGEGVARGTPSDPRGSLWSWPWRARTITCLEDHVPAGW
jgi:hypothetical protein